MPTYEYDCKQCGLIEIMHGFNDNEVVSHCPECGKPLKKRSVLSAPPLVLYKGGGYVGKIRS